MHCERCGRPAASGDGATCRYCGGPLVADDPMLAYGAPNPYQNPYQSPYQNPHQPRPRANRRPGRAILRWIGYAGAVLLTFLVIVVVRVGIGTVFGHFTGIGQTSSPTSFSDPLTSNSGGWPNDANAYFQSDGYHIVKSVIVYAPDTPSVNVDVSVQVKHVSGDVTATYGIVFRRISKGNFYAFEIDSQGEWIFVKVVNGQATPIVDVTANSAILQGTPATNTLEVHATGTHYVFVVNGATVGQADDTTFSGTGMVGLDGNDGVEVIYTHFTMNWHPTA